MLKPLLKRFALALCLVSSFAVAQTIDLKPGHPVEYVVKEGDTLWDLATERTEPGGDVRSVVRRIQQLNDLDGGHITPGQVIVLPAA